MIMVMISIFREGIERGDREVVFGFVFLCFFLFLWIGNVLESRVGSWMVLF